MSRQEMKSTIELSLLKAYHGYQSSIIPLSSGYYFYLASWDSTPTKLANFSNVWLVTPADHRILFADPMESREIVCIYHDFHEIYGASIRHHWISKHIFHVDCRSVDGGFDLEANFHLCEPLSSRLLLAIGSSPPSKFRVSKPMGAISNLLMNALIAKGGSVLVGKTETGQPFYHGDTERLFQVAGGSISLNGEDIGTVSRPTWSIAFGDAIPYTRAVIKIGTLYIPFEQNMVEGNA